MEMYHAYDEDGFLQRRTKRVIRKYDALHGNMNGQDNRYKILIAHDPEHIDRYAECGYDLCLSGHLHGGIIRLPFLGGLVTPRLQFFHKLSKGYFESGKMKMIISGGAGWHEIPFRILNKPEIPVIRFKKTY